MSIVKGVKRKLSKLIFRLMPPFVRNRVIRRMALVKPVGQEYEFKIATTAEELETAYKLLHQVYVEAGLMSPDPSGLRVNIFSSLPYSTTLIAKHRGKVIATVTLIKDSPIGFPSDKDYYHENQTFRENGRRLIEVSALAVHKEYRRLSDGRYVSLQMMKFLYYYARYYMGGDMFCATVHPRAYDFYRALFNFQRNGDVVKYNFVNGALAIHISSDIRDIEGWFAQVYGPKSEFGTYFLKEPNEFKFPSRKNRLLLDPVMTPEILNELFVNKTDLFKKLSFDELVLIKQSYAYHFEIKALDFIDLSGVRRLDYRFPSDCRAAIKRENVYLFGTIFDVSANGAFFETSEELAVGTEVQLVLTMDDKLLEVPGFVTRRNSTLHSRYPKGFGVRFKSRSEELEKILGSAHLTVKRAV